MSLITKNLKSAKWRKRSRRGIEGLSLPEVMMTIGVFGAMAAISAPAFTMGTNSLSDSMNLVEGNFKVARSKAMSQTNAYRVRPDGANRFIMEKHAAGAGSSIYSCDDSEIETDSSSNDVWETAYGFNVDEDMALHDGVQVKSVTVDGTAISDITDWELCFDARGMANKNVILTLEETSSGKIKMLEVFSGGSLIAYDSARFNSGSSSPSGNNAGGGNPNAGGGNPNAGGGNLSAGSGNPNAGGGNPNAGGGNPNAGGGNPNAGGGNPNAGGGNPNAGGGNPNAGGGNPNAGGGNPNAGGGNPNAGGGNPNAGGGNPNAGGGQEDPSGNVDDEYANDGGGNSSNDSSGASASASSSGGGSDCNQGIGNGPDGCSPGNSDNNQISNDDVDPVTGLCADGSVPNPGCRGGGSSQGGGGRPSHAGGGRP